MQSRDLVKKVVQFIFLQTILYSPKVLEIYTAEDISISLPVNCFSFKYFSIDFHSVSYYISLLEKYLHISFGLTGKTAKVNIIRSLQISLAPIGYRTNPLKSNDVAN